MLFRHPFSCYYPYKSLSNLESSVKVCFFKVSLFCYHNNCLIFSWPYVRSFMLIQKSSSKIIHDFLFGIFTSNFTKVYWEFSYRVSQKSLNECLAFSTIFPDKLCLWRRQTGSQELSHKCFRILPQNFVCKDCYIATRILCKFGDSTTYCYKTIDLYSF